MRTHLKPCVQDPFKLDTKLHSELANVSRTWPSVRRDSRMSELRSRSVASTRSSMRLDSTAKADILGHVAHADGHGHKSVAHAVQPSGNDHV